MIYSINSKREEFRRICWPDWQLPSTLAKSIVRDRQINSLAATSVNRANPRRSGCACSREQSAIGLRRKLCNRLLRVIVPLRCRARSLGCLCAPKNLLCIPKTQIGSMGPLRADLTMMKTWSNLKAALGTTNRSMAAIYVEWLRRKASHPYGRRVASLCTSPRLTHLGQRISVLDEPPQ
jgi:hypothetical protein